MKRSSILIGATVVSIIIISILAIVNLLGHSFHEAADQRQSWHDIARQAAPGYPHWTEARGGEENGASAAWLVLLRLFVLVGGALLFLKASGLLRWIGAVFTTLGAWTLLGPVWGTLVLIAMFLLYRSLTRNQPYTSPQAASVYSSPVDSHESRGRFLDEWERTQHKEE